MDRRIRPGTETDRGVSKVVGTVLMVAIVVLLAVSVVAMTGTFGEQLTGPLPETSMNVEQHEAGLLVTPDHIGQEVTVKVNGVDILEFDGGDAGESRLLPVAPGDEVEVVAQNEKRSILIHRKVEPNEARKFVAYYSFEADSGTHLEDRSWQSNHGELKAYDAGDTNREDWVTDSAGGSGLNFEPGNREYVHVPDLDTAEEVEEFTVAVKYRIDSDTGDVQQLVEHHDPGPSDFEWYVETDGNSPPYTIDYRIREAGMGFGSGELMQSPGTSSGDVHVTVATYDGETMRMYQDGSAVTPTKTIDEDVLMGEMFIGADADTGDSQYLDGNIYEVRLYHVSFAEEDAKTLSKIMEADVSS